MLPMLGVPAHSISSRILECARYYSGPLCASITAHRAAYDAAILALVTPTACKCILGKGREGRWKRMNLWCVSK